MEEDSNVPRKAQLDKAEREHLEDVVTEMRDRVEANVRYQLEEHGLETRPGDDASHSDDVADLVTAIDLESADDDDDWIEGYEQYITGVGYTIVNRLAALRCMEVRDFIDSEVTVFREDGLTPAADRLVTEEFMLEEEAVLQGYQNACDDLAEEIEILFDRSTAYSLIDPDDDTFEDLCRMLDEVPDEVWRGDDVLGWVYEYYNVKLLDDLRRKGDNVGLEPEDVPPANQFYTPHWVVRMLTDNSLGKLYLEHTGELDTISEKQEALSAEERKNRPLAPDETPTVADFCTYLVSSGGGGSAPEFERPSDLRIIDPACGSGHFLLYAFDVLERIWRAETDVNRAKIPEKIIEENLYGVDLDMRACQLTAFNLYLKGRMRAAAEGADDFSMPEAGIVCSDAKIANVGDVEQVFEEVASGRDDVQNALEQILDSFEEVHGLGSLLDVRGTLTDLFEDSISGSVQITLGDDPRKYTTLGDILRNLREAIETRRSSDSFLAQDLRSFVRLLDVLAQDYDVALINPPYGTRNRMPPSIKKYIEDHYQYPSEFYINFFEVADRLTKKNGRIGMLVPRTFMTKSRFKEFREDVVGGTNAFDFLAEFGIGILDNATVRTAGTVIRSTEESNTVGSFMRLYDVGASQKEQVFTEILAGKESEVTRYFEVELDEFSKVPGKSICYSTPAEVRDLHDTNLKLDSGQAGVEGESAGLARQGVATANESRFYRYAWEVDDFSRFKLIATGGADAWVVPHVNQLVEWGGNGTRVKRYSNTVRTPNEKLYGEEGLTWTYIKETGRRFGYYPPGRMFSDSGYLYVPNDVSGIFGMMGVLNSTLYHALFLSITTERHWTAGYVGSIPWYNSLTNLSELTDVAKAQYSLRVVDRFYDPTSPYYIAPPLLAKATSNGFFYNNPYTDDISDLVEPEFECIGPETSLREAFEHHLREKQERNEELEQQATRADQILYDHFNISDKAQTQLKTEIFLRTSNDPDKRGKVKNKISPRSEEFTKQLRELIHHIGLKVIRQSEDGIVPVRSGENQPSMLGRIIREVEKIYGSQAEEKLVEIDRAIGEESASDEAYPNLRTFIEDDLFEFHVETMENTPILWKLSTERLLADSKGEGFACFVDYHQTDASLFDRLSNQYLEPRKAELRERRSAANQRRNDESLSTTARAEATETFERCSSGLEQIAEFEEVMQELGSTNERDFDEDDRERVEELAPKVAAFREETARRIETMAELHDRKGADWFEDEFTPNFWDKVEEWREEWLDALFELEYACEEYAKPTDQPVEAHLADLFDYFNWRLKGSDHYSSSGILFMTYYFDSVGAALLDDDGEPHDNLTKEEQMLASLAIGLDDESVVDEGYLQAMVDEYDDDEVASVEELPPLDWYKALAEEIDDRCQAVHKQIPSDWKDRALSEITTAGYQPNHKHGVAINITPLAEKSVVPEIVDDKVL